jgi:spore coat protein U-like protein
MGWKRRSLVIGAAVLASLAMVGKRKNRFGVELQQDYIIFLVLILLATFSSLDLAVASNASAPLEVRATVTRSCKISTASLNVNHNDTPGANVAAELKFACTRGSTSTIAVSLGDNGPVRFTSRPASKEDNKLSYELHQISVSEIWGDFEKGLRNSNIMRTVHQGGIQLHERTLIDRNVLPALPNDMVTVTLNF